MASYEFTTLTCIPGVVRYRGAKIQLLDLPGIIEGAKDGKGRGRQVSALSLHLPGQQSLERMSGFLPSLLSASETVSLPLRNVIVTLAGLQVISTARTCNLILIVLDCLKPISHKKLIEHELEGFGIRLNKKPPAITFRKKDKGGLNFTTTISNPKLDLDSAPLLRSCSGLPAVVCTVTGVLRCQQHP